MSAAFPHPLTLGVHPTARGFGWIAFEHPLSAYDWELIEVRKDKNVACLTRIAELFDRLSPETLVLEAFEPRESARKTRITTLCRGIVARAHDRGIEVAVYSRRDIERCFATYGARTRHEIAEAVARHVPGLADRLPGKRQAWTSEDRRMALFNASALVLTHFRFNAQLFFDQLGDAA